MSFVGGGLCGELFFRVMIKVLSKDRCYLLKWLARLPVCMCSCKLGEQMSLDWRRLGMVVLEQNNFTGLQASLAFLK